MQPRVALFFLTAILSENQGAYAVCRVVFDPLFQLRSQGLDCFYPTTTGTTLAFTFHVLSSSYVYHHCLLPALSPQNYKRIGQNASCCLTTNNVSYNHMFVSLLQLPVRLPLGVSQDFYPFILHNLLRTMPVLWVWKILPFVWILLLQLEIDLYSAMN